MKQHTVLVLFVVSCWSYLTAQEVGVTQQPGIESEITITTNPNNTDEIIISSMSSGSPIIVYRSGDGGDSWRQSSFGEGVADPVLTYGDNNTAYLTFLDFDNTLEMSLAESTNGGASWDIETLALDGLAADRQWIKRDNSAVSPNYGNIYISYFHPESGFDIHLVKIDEEGNVGDNLPIHTTAYDYVQNPAMDITLSGAVVVAFLAEGADGNRKIMAVNSTDGGQTFSTESAISDIHMFQNGSPVTDVVGFAPGDNSRLGNSLQMAIDKSDGEHSGRVYMTWTDFVENNPDEGMNIYLSFSDDNGVTWSSPKIVNDDDVPSSHQYYSGIDVNPSGVLCLSWYDRRVDPENDALTDFYCSFSLDGGATFQNSVKVNSETSDHAAVTEGANTFGVGEYTAIASSQTEAYVVWSDGRANNGDLNVYFATVSLAPLSNVRETSLSPELIINELFPNPVLNGRIQLKVNTSHQGAVEVSIININGQIMKQEKMLITETGHTTLGIDVSDLSNGSYLLEIKHNNGIASKKFIVSKE
jgi:hypothetical protein